MRTTVTTLLVICLQCLELCAQQTKATSAQSSGARIQLGQALSPEDFEQIDAETWLRGVEWFRYNAHIGPLLMVDLQEYDPVLVRQYFENVAPADTEKDLGWKMFGLAAYGSQSDAAEVERLAQQFLAATGGQGEYSQHAELGKYVLLAREGSASEAALAITRITSPAVNPQTRADLLLLSGSAVARSKLAEMAQDTTLGWGVRSWALTYLRDLCDVRCPMIAMSPEFVEAMRQNTEFKEEEGLLSILAKETGVQEIEDAGSIEKARDFVARNKPTPLRDFEKVKTVKGGIDWAKFRNLSTVQPKAGSMQQPVPQPPPKDIQQPNLERPGAAAVPPQKPPAKNTGALIAAGAAILGLLAVLVWFLRKK